MPLEVLIVNPFGLNGLKAVQYQTIPPDGAVSKDLLVRCCPLEVTDFDSSEDK